MAVKKIKIDDVPKNKLDEIKPLLHSRSEYVAIGNNIYEIYPVSAIKLLDVMNKIIIIIRNIQRKKEQEFKELYSEYYNRELSKKELDELENRKMQYLTLNQTDIFKDEDSIKILKDVLLELLEGVDEDDLKSMNTGQLVVLINKLIEINLNTLPPSAKENLFRTNQMVNEEKN